MKLKMITLLALILGIGFAGLAQESNENPKLGKELKVIERAIIKNNSDAKAIELINATNMAKKSKDDYLTKADGYGEAATSAEKLDKFKKKLKKSDSKYKELHDAHKAKKKEKREYISTIDAKYKEIYDKLKAEKEAEKKK